MRNVYLFFLISISFCATSFAQQGMRVGTNAAATEMLHVDGAIRIGESTIGAPEAGTIRFNSTANPDRFEGFDGTSWLPLQGDDLGDHTATENLQLDGNWLSNDGGNEGIGIDNDGNVGVGVSDASQLFHVKSTTGGDRVIGLFEHYIPSSSAGSTAGMKLVGRRGQPTNDYAYFDLENNSTGNYIRVAANSGGGGLLKVYSNTTELLTLASDGALTINNAFTLPTADGTNGQILTTDGSGNVSWGSAATGSDLADADNDTKVQVEETADDDIIRFDLAGTEHFVMQRNANGAARLEVVHPAGAGFQSVFIGEDAGLSVSGNTSSVGIGSQALQNLTNGSYNIAVGWLAGNAITTGRDNIGIGVQSVYRNRTGNYNIGIGEVTLASTATNINRNIAIGHQAGRQVNSNDNTFVGYFAGTATTTGGNNVAFGNNAGDLNTTGSSNTFIGYSADAAANNLTNATAIGANASVGQSNALILGNAADVGIGTSTPTSKLDVVGGIHSYNTGFGQDNVNDGVQNYANYGGDRHASITIGQNIYSNNGVLRIAKDHVSLSGVGIHMPGNQLTGQGNMYFFTNPTSNVTAGTDIGGITAANMVLTSAGNLGVGNTNPQAKLEVTGTVKITGGSPSAGKVLTSDADGDATWESPATGIAVENFLGELNNAASIVGANGGTANFSTVQNTDNAVFSVTANGIRFLKAGVVTWNYDQDIRTSSGSYAYLFAQINGSNVVQTLISHTNSQWDGIHNGGSYFVNANDELQFVFGGPASYNSMDNGLWGRLSITWAGNP